MPADEEGEDRRDHGRDDPAGALVEGHARGGARRVVAAGRLVAGLAARRSLTPPPRGCRRPSRARAPPASRPAGTRRRSGPRTRRGSGRRATGSRRARSETSRIARPSSRSSTRRRCTNSIAPTSRPRVGCAAMSTLRVALDLAREHDLLLVAAGERRGARLSGRRRGRRTAVSSRVRALDHPARAQPAEARDRRLPVVVKNARFSASVNSSTRPRRWRSSGMWPMPVVEALARDGPLVTSSPPSDARGPRRRLRRPVERVDQLRLSVAVDAGDADDLAGAHLERHAAHGRGRGRRRRSGPRPPAAARPAAAGSLSTRRSTSRPTISRASSASVAPSRGDRVDHLAAPRAR